MYRPTNEALVAEVVALPWNDQRTNHADGYDDHLCDATLYGFRAASAYLQKPVADRPTTPEAVIVEQTAQVWRDYEEQQRRASNEHYDVGSKFFEDEYS